MYLKGLKGSGSPNIKLFILQMIFIPLGLCGMIIAFYGWIGLPFCAIYLYFVPYKYFVQLIFEENSNVTLKDKGTEKDDNIEEN